MNEDGKTILVANYKSGNIAVFPVNPDGSLGAESDLKQHEGRSVNNERQNSPHAHFVIFSPDSRFVFAVDLGLDKILRYNVETKNGISKLTNQTIAFNCTPGTGPRQMCFHPNGKYAYLIHELKSIIVALLYDSERGLFTEMQMIATIPENFTAKNKCGGIKAVSYTHLDVYKRQINNHIEMGIVDIKEMPAKLNAASY